MLGKEMMLAGKPLTVGTLSVVGAEDGAMATIVLKNGGTTEVYSYDTADVRNDLVDYVDCPAVSQTRNLKKVSALGKYRIVDVSLDAYLEAISPA